MSANRWRWQSRSFATIGVMLTGIAAAAALRAADDCDSPSARAANADINRLEAYLSRHAPTQLKTASDVRALLLRAKCAPWALASVETMVGSEYVVVQAYADAVEPLQRARDLTRMMGGEDRWQIEFNASVSLLIAYVQLGNAAGATNVADDIHRLVDRHQVDTFGLEATLREVVREAVTANDLRKVVFCMQMLRRADVSLSRPLEATLLALTVRARWFIGDYSGALEDARAAHQLVEKDLELSHSVLALQVLGLRGSLYLSLQQPERAKPVFDEGLSLLEDLRPTILAEADAGLRFQLVEFCAHATKAQLAVGEVAAAARTLSVGQQALGRMPDLWQFDRLAAQVAAARVGADHVEMARMLSAAGDVGGSILLSLQAQLSPTQLAELMRQMPDILAIASRSDRIQVEINLGRAFERQGWSARAMASYVEAIQLIEDSRLALRTGPELPLFFSSYTEPYERTIALLYQQAAMGASFPPTLGAFGGSFAEAALYLSEATHARRHAELYGPALRAAFAVRTNVPPAVREEEETLRVRAMQATDTGLGGVDVALNPVASRSRAEATLNAYRAFADAMTSRFPEYAALAFPRPINNRQLPPALRETWLIAYKVTDQALYWWLIRDQVVMAFRRSDIDRTALRVAVAGFRDQIDGVPPAGLAAAVIEPFREIERQTPLRSDAPPRVIVIPDDVLYQLPFEAFPGVRQVPLGDEYIVSYAPSLLVLAQAFAAPTSPVKKEITFIGDAQDADVTVPIDGRQRVLTRLDPDELTSVVAAARATGFNSVFVHGPQASPDAVIGRDFSDAPYLHFDAHAFAESLDPPPSLVLHRGPDHPLGLLEMSEIVQLRLRARIVVLSACETGLGQRRIPLNGEGVEGLARMFMIAGSKSVLVTLWEVRSDVAAAFTAAFYRELGANDAVDPALAVFRARRTIRASYRLPSLWAPFILVGASQ